VGRVDARLADSLVEKSTSVATNNPHVMEMPFRETLRPTAAFLVVEFQANQVHFGTAQSRLHEEPAATTANVELYGVLIAKELPPVDDSRHIVEGAKVRKEFVGHDSRPGWQIESVSLFSDLTSRAWLAAKAVHQPVSRPLSRIGMRRTNKAGPTTRQL
jgi:hypothetical protein